MTTTQFRATRRDLLLGAAALTLASRPPRRPPFPNSSSASSFRSRPAATRTSSRARWPSR